MSLRTRLLVGMALVAVVLVIVSAIVTITTRDELIGQIDARLTAFATPHHGPPGDGGGPFGEPPQGPPGDVPVRRSDAFEGFVDANGKLVTLFTPNVGADEYHPPDISADDLP